MIETEWTSLPFPFTEVATPQPVAPLEVPSLLDRLLEDAAAHAGVLAAAARDPEVDAADITYALRALNEHLHATVALWRAWREQSEFLPSRAKTLRESLPRGRGPFYAPPLLQHPHPPPGRRVSLSRTLSCVCIKRGLRIACYFLCC